MSSTGVDRSPPPVYDQTRRAGPTGPTEKGKTTTMYKTYKGSTDTDRVLSTEESHHVDRGIYLNVRSSDFDVQASIHLSRATFQEFVKDAQAWLDDTEVKTPTKRAAVIRATMHNGSKTGETRLLSLSDYGDSMPWKDEKDGTWYHSDEFTTTEVLFPGVDA